MSFILKLLLYNILMIEYQFLRLKFVFHYILINLVSFLVLQVTSQGQIIGAIVATDQIIAQAAARMVEIEYKNIEPIIISIEVSYKKNNIAI